MADLWNWKKMLNAFVMECPAEGFAPGMNICVKKNDYCTRFFSLMQSTVTMPRTRRPTDT